MALLSFLMYNVCPIVHALRLRVRPKSSFVDLSFAATALTGGSVCGASSGLSPAASSKARESYPALCLSHQQLDLLKLPQELKSVVGSRKHASY